MKTFTKLAAQGDFIIIKVDDIPTEIEAFLPEGGVFVIAHSRTGHNHVMERTHVKAFKPKGEKDRDLYQMFLSVDAPTEIVHKRSFDTHESILVPPGNYMVRRQREYTAEGFRKAAD